MRLIDIMQHIALPIVVILYGSFAAQSRLTRSQVLEVLNSDFIRTARAKGLSEWTIAWKHVGRPVSIILVTALAGSLGVLLGGSLIVETIFEINGFGKFFYDGILNRDYNVIMFSTLVGSFLTLLGYLLADITYVTLDPRVSFER
jgi:peptide/nickel transport system permease protein